MRKIIFVILAVTMNITIHAQVKIIAHRGASFVAPENTVTSAKLAWQSGADAVECDIYLSKDNKIICSHDANTKRTSGQSFIISETNSGKLRKLDVGSFKDEKYKGEKLPFLDDIIQTVPAGKELVIEIKCGSEVLPFLEKIIRKYEKDIIFTFIAFDLQTITDTKKIFPEKCCYLLCGSEDSLNTNINKAAEAGLNGISLTYSIINGKVMQIANELNLEVYAWTVDNPDEAKRLISLGIKGITTNRPGWLNEKLF